MNPIVRLGKSRIIVYCAIIVLQLLTILYWGNRKTNYHVDEMYSMGYANGIFGTGDYWLKITDRDPFSTDKWLNASLLKEQLVVSKSEEVFSSSFSRVLKALLFGRNYFGLLNIAESVVHSRKAGVMLNSIFFVITEISLISLMIKLHMDKIISYLSLAMFGFSVYALSAALFIRFYMFIIMLLLILLNACYRVWDSDDWVRIILNELLILALVYFSFKNSELVIPYFAALWACFVIVSLAKKKRKQSVTGLAVCAFGIIYIATQTRILSVLLRLGKNQTADSVWEGSRDSIVESVKNLSTYAIMDFFMWIKGLFETHYFATRPVLYILLCAVTLCFIFTIAPNERYSIDIRRINIVTIVALLFWLGVFGASFVLGHGKEVSEVMIYCIIIILFAQSIGLKLKPKMPKLSSDSLFVLILCIAAIVSIIFGDLCSFRIWRYYCYGFVSLTIVFWYAIDRIIKRSKLADSRRSLIVVLAIFVLINSVLPFKIRNVEYIFEDEKDLINRIIETGDSDVVLFLTDDDGPSKHTLYDCVSIVNDNSKMFIANLDQYQYESMDYPSEFILWAHSETDMDSVVDDLEINGYEVDELGTDHCSRIYHVNRRINSL